MKRIIKYYKKPALIFLAVFSLGTSAFAAPWWDLRFTDGNKNTYDVAIETAIYSFVMKASSMVYAANYSTPTNASCLTTSMNSKYAAGVDVRYIGDSEFPYYTGLNGGITQVIDPPGLPYMHNKFILADPCFSTGTLLVGSGNFTPGGWGTQDNAFLFIHDKTVAQQYLDEYYEMWNGGAGNFHAGGNTANPVYAANGTEVYTLFTPDDGPWKLGSKVDTTIRAATESVFFETTGHDEHNDPTSRLNFDEAVWSAVSANHIVAEGVVNNMGGYLSTDFKGIALSTYNYYASTLGEDVCIRQSTYTYFDKHHHKYMVVDMDWAGVGSVNASKTSSEYTTASGNDENFVFVNDFRLARAFMKEFGRSFRYRASTNPYSGVEPAPHDWTPPGDPTSLVVNSSTWTFNVSWTAPADPGDFSRYYVFISTENNISSDMAEITETDGSHRASVLRPEAQKKGLGSISAELQTWDEGDSLQENVDYYIGVTAADKFCNESSLLSGGPYRINVDSTPPCAISGLTALAGPVPGTIKLKWTAPGDDGTGGGDASSYEVKYATKYISPADYGASWVNTYSQNWTPAAYGTEEGATGNRVLSGLEYGTTVWIAIKAYDYNNYSYWPGTSTAVNSLSFVVAGSSAPAAVTDLTAATGAGNKEIDLSWTAPGDDGPDNDIVNGQFLIKYSTEPTDNWADMTGSISISTSVSPGTRCSATVTGLDNGKTYYFYLKTADEFPNWSSVSNKSTAAAWAVGITNVVISKIGENNPTVDEYIELFNPTNQPIILTGASCQRDAASSGENWGGRSDWANLIGTIPAYGFFLIGDSGADQPVDDGTLTINDSDMIALVSNTAEITGISDPDVIDFVGLSNSGDYEGSGPAPDTNGGYVERISQQGDTAADLQTGGSRVYFGNSYDSGDNSNDFVQAANHSLSEPHTSASAHEIPSPPTINSFTPQTGPAGTQIDIYGTYFGAVRVSSNSESHVYFYDNKEVTTYVSWSDTHVAVQVPGAVSGAEKIWICTQDDFSGHTGTSTANFTSVPDNVPPCAVSNLTAISGAADGEVDLTWTAPGNDGTSGDMSGTLEIKAATYPITSVNYSSIIMDAYNSYSLQKSTSYSTEGTSHIYTVTGLYPGTTYYFAVKLFDSTNWSSWSNAAVNTKSTAAASDFAPSVITDLSAAAGDTEVTLNWTEPPGEYDIDHYYFEASTTAATFYPVVSSSNVPAGYTSWTSTGLTNGATYYFRATTFDWGSSGDLYSVVLSSSYSNVVSTSPQLNLSGDTGYVSPTSNSDENGTWDSGVLSDPTDAWTNETNGYAENDNEVDLPDISPSAGASPYYADHSWGGFDFSGTLGSNYAVDGIEVVIVDAYVGGSAGTEKFNISLYTKNNGGAHDAWGWWGSSQTTADYDAVAPGMNITFGGAADQWGLTSPTGVDFGPNTTFKVRVTAQSSSSSEQFHFDHIKVKLYYTAPEPDLVYPCAISNLTALAGSAAGTVLLQWTAPGDDGTGGGNVSSYEVKYATKYIGAGDYDASWVNTYSQNWTPAAYGTAEGATGNRVVSGLEQQATYWFAIKAADEEPNWSSWTSSGTVSWVNTLNSTVTLYVPNIPPAAISNLTAMNAGTGLGGQITLKWTAPGADGTNGGNVTSYRVKYATKYINSSDFYESWTDTYTQTWTPASSGSEEFHVLSGFPEKTTYYFAVKSYDGQDWSVWPGTSAVLSPFVNPNSFNFTTSSAPAAVNTLSALSGGLSIDLHWTSPGDDGTTGALVAGSQFRIKYSSKSTDAWADMTYSWYISTAVAAKTVSAQSITGLTAGTTYYFYIKTADEAGNWSPLSNYTSAYALWEPGWGDIIITEVQANPTDEGNNEFIEIYNQSGQSVDINNFVISDGVGEDSISVWDGSIADTNVSTTTTIVPDGSYAVILDNSYGNGTQPYNFPANTIIVSPGSTIGSSGLLNSEVPTVYLKNGSGVIISSWSLCNDTSQANGASVEMINYSYHNTAYNFLECDDDRFNGAGSGEYCSPGGLSYDAANPPAAISDLTALTGSTQIGTVVLKWTAPGADGTGWRDVSEYQVKYATKYIGADDYYASWVTTYTQSWTPSAFGTEEGTSGNLVISGLTAGATYCFAVKARDRYYNWGAWTAASTVNSTTTYNMVITYPAAVSNLTAIMGTNDGEVNLSWTAPGSDGTVDDLNGTLEVKAATFPITSSNYSSIAYSPMETYSVQKATSYTTEGSSHKYTVTGLYPGTTYYFAVKLYNGSTWSSWSNESVNTASTAAAADFPPPVISNLTAASGGNSRSVASWTEPSGVYDIDYYRIEVSSSQTTFYPVVNSSNVPAGYTSWTSTGLANGTTYYFRAATYDTGSSGDFYSVVLSSAYSNIASALPAAPPPPGTNLLSQATGQWNYGFEDIAVPDGLVWEETGTAGSIDVVVSTFRSGNRSCLFQNLTGNYSDREIVSSTCTVTEGGRYSASIWAYVPGGVGAIGDVLFKLEIRWYDALNNYLSADTYSGKSLSSFDSWEQITYSNVTAPAGAEHARLSVSAEETQNNNYDPYLDDAEFVELVPDYTTPAAISNLTALKGNTAAGTVMLKWTAPGDDGTGGGDVTSYEVKYATKYISSANYDASWVNTYTQSWTPANFGTEEGASGNRVISGLDTSFIYWFAIKAKDDQDNWGVWTSSGDDPSVNVSNSTSPYSNTPPAAISNLTALAQGTGLGGQITLKWTAPGDDGTGGGNVSSYEVRYATSGFDTTDWNFGWVNSYSQNWAPSAYGTGENHILTGISEGSTYYFAVRAFDGHDWSVWTGTSAVINSASFSLTTSSAPAPVSNLSALTGTAGGSVALTWSATGDDGTTGAITGGEFSIRYSTYYNVDWTSASSGWTDFGNKYETLIVTDTSGFGAVQAQTLTGLHSGVTYYFRIRTADEGANWSPLSNAATAWAMFVYPTGDLVIDEISYNGADSGDGLAGTHDYIEIQNRSTWTVGAANYYIGTGSANDMHWASGAVPASGFWVIVEGVGTDQTSGNKLYTYETNNDGLATFSLSATDDIVAVSTANTKGMSQNTDKIIDFVAYTDGADTPATSPTNDVNAAIAAGQWDLYASGNPSTNDGWTAGSDARPGVTINEDFIHRIAYDDSGDLATNLTALAYPNIGAVMEFVPPSAVSNLTALSQGTGLGGQVTLEWTAPGDDGTGGGDVSAYEVKYATRQISAPDYSAGWVNTYSQNWTPVSYGSPESRILNIPGENTTYYFAIKAMDSKHNWAAWTGTSTAVNSQDFACTSSSAPAPVNDLTGTQGDVEGELRLSWTAPGDDGTTGNISDGQFLIRYSSNPAQSWSTMDYSLYIATSVNAATVCSKVLTGLETGATYYFYLKTSDESAGWSPLSNKTTAWAQAVVEGQTNGLLSDGYHDWSFEFVTNKAKWSYGSGGTPDYEVTSQQHDRQESFRWSSITTVWLDRELETKNFIGGVVANSSHTASVEWMSTSASFGNARLRFVADWYDASEVFISSSSGSEFTLSSQSAWELAASTFTSPVGASKAKLKIQAMNSGGTANVYIDAAGFWTAGGDTTPPASVSDLTALTQGTGLGGQVTLKWTAPGDDGTGGGNAAYYEVKYATRQIGAGDYSASWTKTYAQGWTPAAFGTEESYVLSGLSEKATYYFAMRACDGGYWSVWPGTSPSVNSANFNFTTSSAPAPVNDFSAATGSGLGKMDLTWTSPGDDGTTGALASGSQFLIKYSSVSANGWSSMEYSWYVSTAVAQGVANSLTVTGLVDLTSYYFYIKTADEVSNWSGLSNKTTGYSRSESVPPGKVTGFAAVSGAQAALSWTAPGDDGYSGDVSPGQWQIKYSSTTGSTASTAEFQIYKSSSYAQGNTYSETITGLKPRTTYYFWIKARDDSNNWSVWSDSVSAISGSFIRIWISAESENSNDISWGDYDNDGDLDQLIANINQPNRVYANNGDGTFSVIWTSPESEATTSVAWGDYDNDGDLDQLIGNYNGTNRIYRNNGDGTFTAIWNSIETENTESVAWGDYDNDGDLDQLIGNYNETNRIYRNNGDGTFTMIWNSPETENTNSVTWGDYDNDGDLDQLIGNTGIEINRVYRNNGDGTFTSVWTSAEAEDTYRVSWGDYDNDGDLDQLIGNSPNQNRIYRNDGNGIFTNIFYSADMKNTKSIAWGDYDNDGDLDQLLGNSLKEIYRNNGDGTFTSVWTSDETDNTLGVAWGDYDNDGDLDFLITNDASKNMLYRSLEADFGNTNSAPAAPSNLTSNYANSRLELRWDKAGDAETADNRGLYYDIRIATEPVTNDLNKWIISPSTGAGAPDFGNYPHGFVDTATLQPGFNLDPPLQETTYYWQARTIDTCLKKSTWSSSGSYYIGDITPPSAVTGLAGLSSDTGGGIDLTWTSPGDDGDSGALTSGSRFLIKYSSVPGNDWDSMEYSWNISTAVAQGVVNSLTVTGLLNKTSYYFYIKTADEVPNWSGLSNKTTSYVSDFIPPSAVSNLTALAQGTCLGGQVTLKWTAPGDDGASGGNVSSYEIRYATKYISQPDFSASWTSVYSQSWTPAAVGTVEDRLITGLDEAVTYYFAIKASDATSNWSVWPGTSSAVNKGSFNFTTSSAPAPVNDFSASTGSGAGKIDLTWTSPGDDGTTGALSAGSQFLVRYSSVSSNDWDSMEFSWNISTAVSQGVGNSLTVTGLLNQTSYYFYIKTADEGMRWSPLSNKTTSYTSDTVAPAAVSDLTALTGTAQGEVRLSWTAPGDDGASGNVTGGIYTIKAATCAITASNFDSIGYLHYYSYSVSFSTSYTTQGSCHNYTVTGLYPGTTYYFAVKIKDDAGLESSWSSSGVNTASTASAKDDIPGIISNLTAEKGDGQIVLSWAEPSDSDLDFYRFYRDSSTPYTFADAYSFDIDTGNVNYVDTGLENGVTYYYRAQTFDTGPGSTPPGLYSVKLSSAYSSVVSTCPALPTSPPPAPANLTGVAVSSYSVNWSWDDVAGENGYRVKYSTDTATTLKELPINATWWIEENLTANTSYYRVVVSTNIADESGLSNAATCWTLARPPAGSAFVSVWESSVSFNWGANGNPPWTVWSVLKSTDGFQTSTITLVQFSGGYTSNTYTDTGFLPDTSCWYKAAAFNGGALITAYDSVISTVTKDWTAPSNVMDLTALSGGTGPGGQVTLKWTAPGDDGTTGTAASYELRYSTRYISQADFNASWTHVWSASSGLTPSPYGTAEGPYIVTGLDEGATYYFALRAEDNASNWGVWPGTSAAINSQSFDFATSSAPAPVNDLSASAGPGEIYLAWTSPGDDGTTGNLVLGSQFLIKYSSVSSNDWNSMEFSWNISTAVAQGVVNSLTVTGLETGTSYYFYIKTADEGSRWSPLSNKTTTYINDTDAPSAVTSLSAQTGSGAGEIDLSWTAPGDDGTSGALTGSSSFLIKYSTSPADGWSAMGGQWYKSAAGAQNSAVSQTISGLTYGATYYFHIKTSDEAGNWSPLSNKATSWAALSPSGQSNGLLTDLDHDWSFENSASPKSTFTATDAVYGYTSYHIDRSACFTWGSVGTLFGTRKLEMNNFVSPIMANSSNTISVNWLTTSVANLSAQKMRIIAEWYNSSDALISMSTSTEYGLSATGVWELKTSTFTAPFGVAKAKIMIQSRYDSSSGNSGRHCFDAAGFWTAGGDAYAPCPVSNLTALTQGTGLGSQVTLKWTAPGDDGTGGADVSSYELKYATRYISSADYNASWTKTYPQNWTPASFGAEEVRLLTGLGEGANYYFALKATDNSYWSVWPGSSTGVNVQNYATPTSSAPAPVNDFTASTGKVGGSIKLNWTSPGDDGTTGALNSALVHIRYSTAAADQWISMTDDVYISTSVDALTACNYTVTGLAEGATYYFYMETGDEKPNWSPLSNKTTAMAKITPPPEPNGLLFYDLHDWSFENVASAKWTYTASGAEYGSTSQQADRSRSFKWSTLTTDFSEREIVTDEFIAGLVSNSSHTASIEWLSSSAAFAEIKMRIIVEWYDVSNTLISKSTCTEFALSSSYLWETASSTFTSPAGTKKAKLRIQAKNAGSSTVVYFDSAGFWAGDWDSTPPAAISDLTALSQGTGLGGQIALTWTAPGSDGTGGGNIYSYELKYATEYISASDYDSSRVQTYSQSWPPAAFGTGESHVLSGLDEGATYYFALKAYDERNWSVWPGTLTAVNSQSFGFATSSAPAPVNDFSAAAGAGEIYLNWTAPGDDGTTGALVSGSRFLIRYSSVSSNGWNTMDYSWYISTAVAQGTVNSLAVTGLTTGASYYFYIKTADEGSRWSPLSNRTTAFSMDAAAPAAITTLTAVTGSSGGEIDLSWISPGDDGTAGALPAGSSFIVRYSSDSSDGWSSMIYTRYISTAVTSGVKNSLALTGLSEGGTYYIYIKTSDEWNNISELSNKATAFAQINTDHTAPAAVSNLTALYTGGGPGGIITLEWTAPGDDGTGGGDVSFYEVRYATKAIGAADFYASWANSYAQSWTPASAGSAEHRLLYGLDEAATYWFAVSASDGYNAAVWPGTSTVVNGAGFGVTNSSAPAPVNDFYAVAGSGQGEVCLTWTAPGDDGTTGNLVSGSQFLIKYSSVPSDDWNSMEYSRGISTAVASGAVNSLTVTGLLNQTSYYFYIKTADEGSRWSPLSNKATGYTMVTPPVPPSGFSGTAISSYSILWSWTDSSSNEQGFSIMSSTSGLLASLPAGVTTWTESGLSPNASYYRYSQAYNAGGSSSSALSGAWTLAAVPYFTGVSVTSTTALISWNAAGNPDYTVYALSRSTDNFSMSVSTFVSFGDGLTSTSTLASNLNVHTSYYFRVWAYNNANTATVFSSTGLVITEKTYPTAPGSVMALTVSSSSIIWSWQDSMYEDGYYIYSSTGGNPLASLPADTTSWLQTGLSANSSYFVYVTAWNDYLGLSVSSSTSSSVPFTYQAPPVLSGATPSVSSTTAVIFWTGVTGAVYRIERDGIFVSSITASSVLPSFTDTGLSTGTAYSYDVYAVNEAGQWNASSGINIQAATLSVYLISGTLKDSLGAAISGVKVSINGSASTDTVTDSSGYYQFAGMVASGSYTVTPSTSDYVFDQVSISTISLSGNISDWDFIGTAVSIAPVIEIGKPGFVSVGYPLVFGSDVIEISIFSPGGRKILNAAGNIWYGTENNSQPSSSSGLLESGAYIYKAKTSSGEMKYGTVVIVK